ncbi:ribose 5-phosphate isomerase B [Aeromicrobium sp. 9AM]|uniref:ribose 5-phosphate isomerase B n=1 Tax=Aeromicrobium sp. 9AM TaxID=2653126 RepID=UPI0012F20B2F|nr:ribose 5-phosphate isomerase B [Aeromicrobium sp. 9AM]VXB73119.1 Ribose-5-P isomerase B [Aeromicrobium sp. 9AM]
MTTSNHESGAVLPRLALGSDHLGLDLKQELGAHLADRGYVLEDLGCFPGDEVDYPDVAEVVARAVADGTYDRGLLVCGTGIGMAIAANKIPGIRAASVSDIYSAERASKSNNAQILCLGSLVVGPALAKALVEKWVESEFAGGGSTRKVDKLNALDSGAGR